MGCIEGRAAGIAFGMLSDRDVASQAHRDVLAAVPKAMTVGRPVRRLVFGFGFVDSRICEIPAFAGMTE